MRREHIWQFQNDWVQFKESGWNWITFRFLECEVERDYQFDGWTLTVVVLGVGFYYRFNTGEATEESVEMERRVKSLTSRLRKGEGK